MKVFDYEDTPRIIAVYVFESNEDFKTHFGWHFSKEWISMFDFQKEVVVRYSDKRIHFDYKHNHFHDNGKPKIRLKEKNDN